MTLLLRIVIAILVVALVAWGLPQLGLAIPHFIRDLIIIAVVIVMVLWVVGRLGPSGL
jgi:high-affinity Fe2+/Pb2+ permease